LVWVQELGYQPGFTDQPGLEADELDAHSVLVLAEKGREVAGCSRLTGLRDCESITERLFVVPQQDIPREHLGEIGRFALAESYRGTPTGRSIRLGMYRLLTELALERDIWLAYISALPEIEKVLISDGLPLAPILPYHRLRGKDGGPLQLDAFEFTPYVIDMREAHKVLHGPSAPR
jgi:N-acyl-L-homoserine lactone synthetase